MGVTPLTQRCTDWVQPFYWWDRPRPSPWPSLTVLLDPFPFPDLAQMEATQAITTSSTSTCLHTRPLSGATGEATPTTTGRVPQPEGPHIQGQAEVARFLRRT